MTTRVKVRNLKEWDKIKVTTIRDWVEQEEVLTFRKMDGMYGQFFAKDWKMFNATGTVELKDDFITLLI